MVCKFAVRRFISGPASQSWPEASMISRTNTLNKSQRLLAFFQIAKCSIYLLSFVCTFSKFFYVCGVFNHCHSMYCYLTSLSFDYIHIYLALWQNCLWSSFANCVQDAADWSIVKRVKLVQTSQDSVSKFFCPAVDCQYGHIGLKHFSSSKLLKQVPGTCKSSNNT